jgi:ABC-type transport system involved in multi-copper enzyme maturation permease subunit
MAGRIGPGPVFVYESLIFARRWQVYAGRGVFVLAILIGLAIAWWSNVNEPLIGAPVGTRVGTLQVLARVGESFFWAMAGIQLAMVLLVAPAATAGAICHDRARGILAQMAATDLSSSEIVLGKLFSRLAPVLGLLACALPVAALAALLGGIDIPALLGLFAVSSAVAVLGCALALRVSVRVDRTQDAIMAVLALLTFWLLGEQIWRALMSAYGLAPPPDWFRKANPFILVYAPYVRPGYVEPIDVAAFVVGALAISGALAASTIAMLRRAVLPAEATRPARRRCAPASRLGLLRRWTARLPGPSLDGNPVLWRDWHRGRSSRLARVLWGIYWLASIVGFGLGMARALEPGTINPLDSPLLAISMVVQPFLGLLLLSCRAPTALTEERDRRTLDVLMSTPLSTWSIVRGKWLAAYRVVPWLAVLPGLAATVLACAVPVNSRQYAAMGLTPPSPSIFDVLDRLPIPALVVAEILSVGAAITSLGLLLATWTARPGRAIAVNVAAFVLIAVGWPFGFLTFIVDPLRHWLVTAGILSPADDWHWLGMGMVAISPALGPILTLAGLDQPWAGRRWMFTLIAMSWCLLAAATAVALYGEVLATFDRRLGRMPENGQGGDDDGPPRLAPDLVACQNDGR